MEIQCLTIKQALKYILYSYVKKINVLRLKVVDLVVAIIAQQDIHYSSR